MQNRLYIYRLQPILHICIFIYVCIYIYIYTSVCIRAATTIR